MSSFILYASFIIVLSISAYYWFNLSRSAEDTYRDLVDEIELVGSDEISPASLKFLADEAGQMGLFTTQSRKKFALANKLIFVLVIFGAELLITTLKGLTFSSLIMTAVFSWGLAFFVIRFYKNNLKDKFQQQLDYYLPVVMERLVMAVEAGFDIVSAVCKVVELEKETAKTALSNNKKYDLDPVTTLLDIVVRLSNAGAQFSQSLSSVANCVDNASLKHAFIHLALAQKEGGEVIMPLRELSDATQLQYQEVVEERIAKLPVKATLPLVITFTGLIVFFLTGPIIQIIKVTSGAMPK